MSHHNPFNNLLTLLFVTLIRQYQGHTVILSQTKKRKGHTVIFLYSQINHS